MYVHVTDGNVQVLPDLSKPVIQPFGQGGLLLKVGDEIENKQHVNMSATLEKRVYNVLVTPVHVRGAIHMASYYFRDPPYIRINGKIPLCKMGPGKAIVLGTRIPFT